METDYDAFDFSLKPDTKVRYLIIVRFEVFQSAEMLCCRFRDTYTFNKSNVLRRIRIYRELYQFPCYVGSDLVVCMTSEMICKVSL